MLKRTAKFASYTVVAVVALASLYLNVVGLINNYGARAYQKGAVDAQAQIVQGLMNEVKKGEVTLDNGKEQVIIVNKASYGGNAGK